MKESQVGVRGNTENRPQCLAAASAWPPNPALFELPNVGGIDGIIVLVGGPQVRGDSLRQFQAGQSQAGPGGRLQPASRSNQARVRVNSPGTDVAHNCAYLRPGCRREAG
ncbi:hypothetical protein KRMM14A1259_46470 [Krasilnikovia sp. MM14-A1259]